jgi:HPt (histidine-containing phosphotransfer) domain-containing protein
MDETTEMVPPSDAVGGATPEEDAEPAIDAGAWANLLDMTGGDQEFVDELADTYLEEGTGLIATLRRAAPRGVGEEMLRSAHSLKSSSVNLGALRLGGLARSLEEASRAGDVPDADARVMAIEVEFERVRRAIRGERERRAAG